MIEIKKGIPVCLHRKYPFQDMEVGDCFDVEFSERKRIRITVASSQYGKRHGKKFAVRYLKDEGIVRCWRLE